MSLLDKLQNAVNLGLINHPFTTNDLKSWMNSYNIKNDNTGMNYSNKYKDGFLSSSTIGSTSTKRDKRLTKMGTTPESYIF